MTGLATIVLIFSWILFSAMLAWNHARVRGVRKRQGIPEDKPSIRDPRSMHGLLLEGVGFIMVFFFARSPARAKAWQCTLSMLSSLLSVTILAGSLRHLGLQWRIKAVVTDDHHLVTSGPYAYMRHPVFAALTLLLLATAILLNTPSTAIAAVIVSLSGTAIRIRAEDGLLLRRFGHEFTAYCSRVRALLPIRRKIVK